MVLPIKVHGADSAATAKITPTTYYLRAGMGMPIGSLATPTVECAVDAVGDNVAAPVVRTLQLLSGGVHPDDTDRSFLGIPVGKKGK